MTARSQTAQRPADRVLPSDPADRQAAFWRMSPAERVAAMRRGELTLFEALRWAARAPAEVPLVNGEFEFITAFTPEAAEVERP